MVSSADHQPGIGQSLGNIAKGFDHQFQPLVRSPLPEGQNAVLRIAASGKIRILRFSGKNAMRTQVHVVATIFFMQDLAISRHEHRNGIRQKKHLGGDGSRQTVGARVTNTSIFQIDGVHQMMQGDVGIATGQTGKHRGEKSGKSNQRIAAESAEEKIKPNHIWFELADRVQNVNGACRVVERPASLNRITFQFRFWQGNLVSQNSETNEGIAMQLLSNVEAVFTQATLTGWKGCDQANLHESRASRRSTLLDHDCRSRRSIKVR
jgi:hypothetical protein